MAYANDPSGGRTGPYWRRQLGITLPGERTAAELAAINFMRQKQGLPAEGGPIGDNTRFITQAPQVARRAGRSAQPAPNLREILQQAVLRRAQSAPDLRAQFQSELTQGPALEGGPTFGQGIDEANYQPPRVPAPAQEDPEALRQRLLAGYQGAIQPSYSRDALRNYVQQHMQRRAMRGNPRQPILPQRRPRRAMPY